MQLNATNCDVLFFYWITVQICSLENKLTLSNWIKSNYFWYRPCILNYNWINLIEFCLFFIDKHFHCISTRNIFKCKHNMHLHIFIYWNNEATFVSVFTYNFVYLNLVWYCNCYWMNPLHSKYDYIFTVHVIRNCW